jgi:phospholipid/cholesterol/gamma-HCH transport system substrate-binding protein
MKEQARNLAVGITVIVALCMLGGMILIFAGLPEILQRGYQINVHADATYDLHEGDAVHLAGMAVGRVTRIDFADPQDPARGILITLRINHGVHVPSNAKAMIYTKGFMGGAFLELKGEGPMMTDPATGKEIPFLPIEPAPTIAAVQKGNELIPPELTKLAGTLGDVLAPPPSTATPTTWPSTQTAATSGFYATMERINRTLDATYMVLGDPANQANLKKSLANLSKLTDNANQLAQKLMDTSEKMSSLLTTLNNVARKLEAGEGTAGKFLNDPKLYNSLVNATSEVTALTVEMRVLVEDWKKSGVPIKLK